MAPAEPKPLADPTSAPWIHRLATGQGNDPDWQALFERYRAGLLIYARRQLGPQLVRLHSPEDLVQSAWADIFPRIEQFEYRGPGSLRAWLRTMIRRQATRLGQRAKPDESTVPAEPASDLDVPGAVVRAETHTKVLAALDRLPPTYRRVVEARFLEGRRVVAIARALRMKPDTVSQQIRRGLALWQQELGDDPSSHFGALD